jgi:hypothetical protein
MECGLGKSTGMPRLLMAVVMVVLLMSTMVANSTAIETGSRLNEGTKPQQLGGWIQSEGKTKKGLSQKQVIYLRSQSYRCLLDCGWRCTRPAGWLVYVRHP